MPAAPVKTEFRERPGTFRARPNLRSRSWEERGCRERRPIIFEVFLGRGSPVGGHLSGRADPRLQPILWPHEPSRHV